MTDTRAQLWSVEGNTQRLDGGAMFGNAPRALWSRWVDVDEDNLIPLATRALLVREPTGRTVMFEAGIGAFFSPEMRARYGVVEDRHVLLENLAGIGVDPGDVDVVVLSHLHFDHAGGLLESWREGADPALAFPRAAFVVSQGAMDRARQPVARDRASFIEGFVELLESTGRVEVVAGPVSATLGEGYRFHLSEGHTPGLLLTELDGADAPVVFAGDLVPGRPWMHVPITMGYDRYPELLVQEKAALLEDLHARGGRLFLTHDPEVAMVGVGRDDRGRYVPAGEWAQLDHFAA